MKQNVPDPGKAVHLTLIILSALILSLVLFIRIRLLSVPLERDEGEFAYMGQLLLNGIPPYLNAYTMKLPGVAVMYAVFMLLFGQSTAGIHLGLLVVNGISTFLVYLLANRLFDRNAALMSCTFFAVLSLSQSVFGPFAHATHFVVMFALAGFLLLLSYMELKRSSILFVSGCCFGLAVIMKQHGAIMLVFALIYFFWEGWRGSASEKKRLLVGSLSMLVGATLPYAAIVLWMKKAGALNTFWFWTVQYPREYVSEQTLARGVLSFIRTFNPILQLQLPFWLLAGIGTVALYAKKTDCRGRLFISGFLLFSFLSICPGLYFREHYFILLLPAIAILAGAAAYSVQKWVSTSKYINFQHAIPVLLLIASVAHAFVHEREFFFAATPQEASRATYGPNPFPEAPQIAAYIKSRTSPGDRIAVLGSEPEICFYADRLSATGHIYMYGLMEKQRYAEQMQLQLIREVEAAHPKYVLVVHVAQSWLIQPTSSNMVQDWAKKYIETQYENTGVIDIVDSNTTRYMWDDMATGYTPVSNAYVMVFRRKIGG